MVEELRVVAFREGKWWSFSLPDLSIASPVSPELKLIPIGQSAKATSVGRAAEKLASVWTGRASQDFTATVNFQLPRHMADVLTRARELEEKVRKDQEEVDHLYRQVIRKLLATRMAKTEVCEVTGLSANVVKSLLLEQVED